jgi:carbon-monoxide dehydrogenase medium subunit
VSIASAHDATITVAGPNGVREIAFKDFPAGFLTPAIELNEIVTMIRIPLWPTGHKASFTEFARRHGDFAVVSAAAMLQIESGKIKRASVTLGGVAVAPARVANLEQAIVGHEPSSDLFRRACEICRGIEAMSDIHASSEYRQPLAVVDPSCARSRLRFSDTGSAALMTDQRSITVTVNSAKYTKNAPSG